MRGEYGKEVRSFYRKNPEIEALVKRRRRRLFWKLVFMELLSSFVSYEIYDYGRPIAALVIGVALAVFLPLFALSPWRVLGKGYVGEIVGSREELRRDFEKGDVALSLAMRSKTQKYVTYLVSGDDGKRHSFRVRAPYARVYGKGVRILRIKGLGYPIPLTVREHTVCLFCGARVLSAVDHCAGCARRSDV